MVDDFVEQVKLEADRRNGEVIERIFNVENYFGIFWVEVLSGMGALPVTPTSVFLSADTEEELRILEAYSTHYKFKYRSPSEVAEQVGVSWNIAYDTGAKYFEKGVLVSSERSEWWRKGTTILYGNKERIEKTAFENVHIVFGQANDWSHEDSPGFVSNGGKFQAAYDGPPSY